MTTTDDDVRDRWRLDLERHLRQVALTAAARDELTKARTAGLLLRHATKLRRATGGETAGRLAPVQRSSSGHVQKSIMSTEPNQRMESSMTTEPERPKIEIVMDIPRCQRCGVPAERLMVGLLGRYKWVHLNALTDEFCDLPAPKDAADATTHAR